MEIEDITIVHYVPGRVRLRLGKIKNNPEVAREVKQLLSTKAGIFCVEVSPTTGSVLLHFDPAVINLSKPQTIRKGEKHGAMG